MEVKVCAVITANNLLQVQHQLKKAQKYSKWIELRADYLPGISSKDIMQLSKICKGLHTIFTLRDVKFGGKFDQGSEKRIELFNFALTQDFELYDVDLVAFPQVAESLKLHNKKFIVSYHNFDKTPDTDELNKIYLEMAKCKPFIIKIAVMVNKITDMYNLTALLLKYPKDRKIIIGMGAQGALSRVVYPFFGSYLTFASLDKKGSAPGQLSLSQITKIYLEISKKITIY